MRAGTKSDKVGKDSPQGDLSKRDDGPALKFFKREIKKAGISEHASDYLPYRAFEKAGGNDGYGG